MKLFYESSPAKKIICITVVIQLLLLPVSEAVFAQVAEDNTPPTIVHLPIKTGIKGQTIPVIARVADDSEVGTVSVNFKNAGRFLDIPIQMVKTGETGTLKIKVTVEACYVFSGPGMWYDTLATVTDNEVFDTFEEEKEHGFYHIKLSDDVDGWISFAHSDPVMTGAVYSGVIPSTATMTDELVYRISAEDIHHNKLSTLPYTIHLIRPDEQKEQKEQQKTQEQMAEKVVKPKPFYQSPIFLGIVGAAVVGGVVAATSKDGDKKDGNNSGSISVNGEW